MEVPINSLVDLLLCCLIVLQCQSSADSSPSFLSEPRSRIVKHNIRVKLRCKVDPKDAPVWWALNGQDITDPASLGMQVAPKYLKIESFQGQGESSHNGDYQCKAGNRSGMIVSRIAHVQAAYLKRFSTHLPMTTYAKKGRAAVIECKVPDSVPPAVMSYEFKGQTIADSSDHYRIMPSGHLHIIDVSEADEGHYRCLATNPALSKTHSSGNGTTLVLQDVSEVHIPPSIQTSSGASVKIQEMAVLECIGDGIPYPNVQWNKVDGSLPDNAIQYPGSLEISSVSRNDAGTYTCTALNEQGQQQRSEVRLEVIEPVSIAKAPKNTHVDLGGTGHFKCTARGVNPSQIVWLFNGQRISEMSPRHEILDGQLSIMNVARSDLGPYQCFVHTAHGSAQATAKLMLREGFPAIVEPPVNTTAIEGENVFLSCGITGDPMPFVSWSDPLGTVVRNTRSMFISEETGGLTISRVGPEDVGWYRCMAANKHGRVAAEAYLAVIEKLSTTPVPESSSRPVLNPPVNDDITITTQTTDEPNKPGTVPDAPTKPIIIKTSDTSVETRWDYFSRIPVTSFTIQYRDVASVDGWVVASNVIPPSRRVYEVQGLREGATYRFRVIASNTHGDSEASEMSNRFLMHVPGSTDPPVRPPLDPPRIVNCVAMSSTSILVEWEFDPEFPDIPVTGFFVHYRNTDSDDDNDYTRTPVVGEDIRRYQIRNLEAELTYDIKMQTFNDGGQSPFSNVIIRETMAQETPPPPIILPDPYPSNPSPGGRNPNIPSIPDDIEPDTSTNQGEDILYITLGVVLGAMLLVLIMFGVMCIWRAKQVNNDRLARDWHYGYYCDGAYRHNNGNAYKFGPYMNGNTPQGHGGGNPPFGETATPADPRPLYTMPQDTLDEANYFPGLSPQTSPVANGHIPATNQTLQPCHMTRPSENTNSNHSSGASNEHLYVNGSCRSLRCAGGCSDKEGHQGHQGSYGPGAYGPGLYGTGDRPVCPSRHPKSDRSRRKKQDGTASREATDSEIASDVPSSSVNTFPPSVAQTAHSPDVERPTQQGLSSETNHMRHSQGSHDSINQLQQSTSCTTAKHSDI